MKTIKILYDLKAMLNKLGDSEPSKSHQFGNQSVIREADLQREVRWL